MRVCVSTWGPINRSRVLTANRLRGGLGHRQELPLPPGRADGAGASCQDRRRDAPCRRTPNRGHKLQVRCSNLKSVLCSNFSIKLQRKRKKWFEEINKLNAPCHRDSDRSHGVTRVTNYRFDPGDCTHAHAHTHTFTHTG